VRDGHEGIDKGQKQKHDGHDAENGETLTGRIIACCYLWAMPTAVYALTGRSLRWKMMTSETKLFAKPATLG